MVLNLYNKVFCRMLVPVILQFIFCSISSSQSREVLIKAGYIEKFTHFVQWPESKTNGSSTDKFTIAIIGDNTISKPLKEIFSKSNTKGILINIIEISRIEDINDCQLLFISSSEKAYLDRILLYTKSKPILTISDSKGFGEKGVIINMFYEGDYIRYEINRQSLDKSGLVINSLLLRNAVII